jgi:NAD(P)H-quinone oxidoreductase subunit 5
MSYMLKDTVLNLFYFDAIAQVISYLVLLICLIAFSFANRYLEGDSYRNNFLWHLVLLGISVITMANADHVWLFFTAWVAGNWLLVRMIIHNPNWKMAENTGKLATKNFAFSSFCIGLGLLYLQILSSEISIQNIILTAFKINDEKKDIALFLIMIGAAGQSAIWPFHRWLISSLNAPTPVSALMHAGLINGGGFILIRFSPLYANEPVLLNVLFCLGIATAILATFWKLAQSNNKRMLANSTVAQMGFMFAQCGLGLFSAALCHICWHGLFKAYLFFAAGSAASEKKLPRSTRPKMSSLVIALLLGVIGSYVFAHASGKVWVVANSNLVLTIVAFITSTQFALTVLSTHPLHNFFAASIFTFMGAYIYGGSIGIILNYLSPLYIDSPQPLNFFHIIGMSIILGSWLLYSFRGYWQDYTISKKIYAWLYVRTLNASQPHPSTITAHHNDYRYN